MPFLIHGKKNRRQKLVAKHAGNKKKKTGKQL